MNSDKNMKSVFSRTDFQSEQTVKWCPGCGDYVVLSAIQRTLASFNRAPHEFVFISGIGCSSRLPHYIKTYGFHTIHGRAPAIATGVKLSNPALSVWVITGDGDGLSIGGNHLIHLLRRNLDMNVILLNNRIYALTKGQFSPTTPAGRVTKSAPEGVKDYPINPVAFALGTEATFVARTTDTESHHISGILSRAYEHRGTSFIEVYQHCVLFEDEEILNLSNREYREDSVIYIEHGKPLIFGKERNKALKITGSKVQIVNLDGSREKLNENEVTVYDETDLHMATVLAKLPHPQFPIAIGVFYSCERQVFEDIFPRRDNLCFVSNFNEILDQGESWQF